MRLRFTVNHLLKAQLFSRIKVLILRNAFLNKVFRFRYFSLNNLDMKLEQYLDFNNGFFVELGANDGVNQSNTLFFERSRGWKGVLIEPYLPNYRELIRNRSSGNYFKNTACVGPSYTAPTVQLVYSNLMTSTLGIKSDIPDPLSHAKQGSKFWGGDTFVFESPASTLNSILIEANAPVQIDLLSLDVEGVELEILKGIDHSMFSFGYICVESRQFTELQEYLTSKQYSYVEALSTHDYLFKKS
jgi:FkbM family methyltransferase